MVRLLVRCGGQTIDIHVVVRLLVHMWWSGRGGVKVCFYEIAMVTIKHGRGHEHSY